MHLFLIIWLTRQERAKKLQHKDPKIYINCDKLLENADAWRTFSNNVNDPSETIRKIRHVEEAYFVENSDNDGTLIMAKIQD